MKQFIVVCIACILFTSCEKDNDNEEIVTLKVNHYQKTAIGQARTLVLLVQKDEHIGSNEWTYFYEAIEGFEYELGFVYELKTIRREISNPPADGASVSYELLEIISKTPTEDETPFQLILKSSAMFNPPSFVFGDFQSGYTILDEIGIDCNSLCNELESALHNENEVTGVFTHINPNLIKLEQISIDN